MIGGIAKKIESIDAPVLRQEMRIRQRGGRAFGVMFGYIAMLSIIAILMMYISDPPSSINPQIGTSALERAGRYMFRGLTYAQLVMVILVVPAYSAGVISMEREKGSFDLLAITTLRSASIVTQKLWAALAQVVLLLIASVPVLSIVFLLGGVSPGEVAVAYALIAMSAAAVGALGVMCSCYFANTRAATFMTYLVTVLFLAGLPIAGAILESYRGYSGNSSGIGYALGITLAVAFAAGIIAVFMFGMVALILRKTTGHWNSRTFRMWIFGATYAAVLLVFNIPSICYAIMDTANIGGLFMPLFVNAFVAMAAVVNPETFVASTSLVIVLTLLFSAGCAYLFRNLSVIRFNAIRRV
ncbi:MAG: hypothetical protein ABFD83_09300 [Armatimonadota bacterium]